MAPGRPAVGADAGWPGRLDTACGVVLEEIDDVLAALPFAVSPRPTEVTVLLHGDDVKTTEIDLPDGSLLPVMYVDNLVDKPRLWDEVLRPLMAGLTNVERLPRAMSITSMNELLYHLLVGRAVLLPPDGLPRGVEVQGLKQRQVDEPTTERSIVGPKESLVENLDTNLGLVRNRLRDPRLRVEFHVVGRRSKTRVALLYVADVAWPDLVQRTRQGLADVAIDHVRTAMDVSELIFNRSMTAFPLVEQTERPDRVAGGLALGRLALMVEGTPFCILVPVTFFEFQKDSEGALPGPLVTAFVRNLRILGLFVALMLPGLYVAVLSADVSILPVPLALTLSTSRFDLPYPVLTETLLMLVIADVLSEATTQAASAIGNTLAIVGTLIVGQMIVQARLASNLQMIIIASTIMGSFLTLKYPFSYAVRIWKYPIVVLSGIAGLVGLFGGFLILLVHLASLKSAGVPYLRPLAPFNAYDLTHYGPVQPNRGQLLRRPAMWNPRQSIRSRRGGR